MGLVWLGVLTMDALPGEELDEGSSHVLPTLVVTRSLHPQPQAIFGIGLKRLETEKASLFLLKKATTQNLEASQINVIQ